jgi:hypothetical protein
MEAAHGQRIDFDIAQPHPRNRQPAHDQPPDRKRTNGERANRECSRGKGSHRDGGSHRPS